ncbi:hypothetical protein, partial [Mesomycoplasma ovipneumoniae]|uniref:hypothetical protein n=1 Tax=Mesomycoplasma ovipneumoniae TaxID=29562 RepID=UPI003080C0FA
YVLTSKGELALLPHAIYSERHNSGFKNFVKNLRLVDIFLQLRQKYFEYKNNKALDYPIDYHVYDKKYSKDYEDAWQETKKIIIMTKQLTEQNGGKYILITLANNEQVNRNVWNGLIKTYPGLKKADLDLNEPDRNMIEFCGDNNIECYEMLSTFKEFIEKNPSVQTHYFNDGHFNQIGTNV